MYCRKGISQKFGMLQVSECCPQLIFFNRKLKYFFFVKATILSISFISIFSKE